MTNNNRYLTPKEQVKRLQQEKRSRRLQEQASRRVRRIHERRGTYPRA